MSVAEEKRIEKYLIKIEYDQDPINPRVDYDNLSVMACFHSRYSLGDLEWKNNAEGARDFQAWFKEVQNEYVWKTINLYDHSGLTISTSNSYPYNDRWDSGQVGIIYVEKKRILKEFGLKEWSPEAEEKANAVLDGEVKTYDYYLRGDVYGYTIQDTEDLDRELDSCWGFLGDRSDCMKEAEDVVNHYIKKDKEWEDKAIESTIYVEVKVKVKHSPSWEPETVLDEADYSFKSTVDDGKIIDTKITGYSKWTRI